MEKILDKVNYPEDLKKLTNGEMVKLSDEMRQAIINRVSNIGGHVGPNLGIVEATIAMHYVFNSPIDKIVFDVSHQSYPHKILTGRKSGFLNSDDFEKISGFTNPDESEHDFFKVGHTSTSISLACGLAKARDLKKEKENIIVVIGDGSLSGGEAYEGLNNASELNSNIIIVVNDNNMSIAPNYGGLYKNLKLLRDTDGKSENNFFKSIGFDYFYVKDGNNLDELIDTFKEIKDIDHPVIVHVNTLKGKGLSFAEENKEVWHWNIPFDKNTGKPKFDMGSFKKNYQQITSEYLLKKSKEEEKLMVITPAVPGLCGFDSSFRKELGEQFIDVGIAEEHAIAFASGLAKNGAKPVVGMGSSFIQRTYDQLSQDLAINKKPAVILVFFNGITSMDATHLGTFDISLISNIPNIVYLSPTCGDEYLSMLDWAVDQNEYPVVIRVPNDTVLEKNIQIQKDYSKINEYKVEKKGKNVAIIALGSFYTLGEKIVKELLEKENIEATLINPRYSTGIDKELLEKLKEGHNLVVTLEEGILDGGFGEKIDKLKRELDYLINNTDNYNVVLKKSQELDYYITLEMKIINKELLIDLQKK